MKITTYRHIIFFQINDTRLMNMHIRISVDSSSCLY